MAGGNATASKGVELAAAYVSIGARTDGMAKDIKAALASAADGAGDAGKSVGVSMRTQIRQELAGRGWAQDAIAKAVGGAGDDAGKKAGEGFVSKFRGAIVKVSVASALAHAADGAGDKAAQSFFQEFRSSSHKLSLVAGRGIGYGIAGGIRATLAADNMVQSLRGPLAKFEASGGKLAKGAGAAVGRTAAMALRAGVAGVGVGGLLSAGGVLSAGFDRLKNIDEAEFKLKALGHDPKSVKSIMDSALASVKGTAFGMGEAANVSASAVAAGVNPGDDLTNYLKTVGDAAAVANTSLDDMGSIFNKITTSNKAYTDDLNQLAGRGLPIFQWLQKEYGVTADALSDMVSDGKVDAATFQKVIRENIGGAAQNMGKSFSGSLDNLKAAIGRLGASFLAPLLGDSEGKLGGVTSAIGALTGKLDGLNVWVSTHQGTIRQFFATTAEIAIGAASGILVSIGGIVKGIGYLVGGVGNALGTLLKGRAAISDFFGNDEDADKSRAAAESAFGWGEGIQKAGDGLIHFGQSVMATNEKVKAWGEAGKNASQILGDAIGGAVASINGKDIVLKSNTPEVAKQLGDLGVKLESLPDGQVKLVPNTPEAQQAVDEWLGKNNPTAQPVTTAVEIDTASADQKLQGFIAKWSQYLFGGAVEPIVNPFNYGTGSTAAGLPALGGGGGSVSSSPPLGVPSAAAVPPTRLPVGGGGQGYMDLAGMSAYLDNITATRNMDTTGLKPGAQVMKRAVYAMFPNITDIGGYRAHDPYPDHPSGNALDIMVPDAATGNAVNQYLLANRQAFGLQYDLWQQKTWRSDGSVSGMEDRGSPTQNHFDHVHGMTGAAMSGTPKFPWQIGFRLRPFAAGGGVWGAGTATSDSIPAWLSNGEHVLTAADVSAMGGQSGVYAFRAGLHGGASAGQVPWHEQEIQPTGKDAGDVPDRAAGSGGMFVGLPDWSPGTKFGAPPPGWWDRSIDPDDILFPDWMPPGQRDQWLEEWGRNRKKWKKLGYAVGGAVGGDDDELRKQLQQQQGEPPKPPQAPNPNTTQHGSAPADFQPGPAADMLKQLNGPIPDPAAQGQSADGQQQPDYGMDFLRSMGFTPASAGSSGVAGTSSLAGFINMGNSVVSGVIDTGVNLANQAVSAAISAGAAAGTFGAAAPAAPAASMAASYGIQLAGNEAKRVSQYWFQMAGIGADALMEQMFPFGAPRWLGYDYTQFAPQLGIQQAATSTLEKMGSDAINKAFTPADNGSGPGATGGPEGGPSLAPSGPSAAAPAIPNAQWDSMTQAPPPAPAQPLVGTLVTQDIDSAFRELNKVQNRNAMQYTGRP